MGFIPRQCPMEPLVPGLPNVPLILCVVGLVAHLTGVAMTVTVLGPLVKLVKRLDHPALIAGFLQLVGGGDYRRSREWVVLNFVQAVNLGQHGVNERHSLGVG